MSTDSATEGQRTTDHIGIDVDGLQELPDPARAVFRDYVQGYAEQLLTETTLSEASFRRPRSALPEYTSAHVVEAERMIRSRGWVRPRPRRWWVIPSRLLQWGATLFAGQSLGALVAGAGWGWAVAFAAEFAAAVFLTLIVEVTDAGRNER